jgi:pteridine reductase
MAASIEGKTALITGGAKRIGRETALALASAGANVVVHYRSSSAEAEALAAELVGLGVGAWTLQADLSDQRQVESLIARSTELAGPIQILINNASAFPKADFETVTLDELMSSVAIDAWAPFALGRSFVTQPEAAHIVNMLDTRIVANYDWSHFAYNASKHMLGLFTTMMAVRFAPRVAVNAVAPGLILPPEGKPVSYIEGLKDSLPLKRIGDPAFVADAILFLVTSEFITGQVIFVDGGRHVREAGSG